jgi:hypothetical protein
MSLPKSLKLELIERFTPLLYLDTHEPDYPVSPVDYAEHSALWSSQPPDHVKNNWGAPAGSDRQPLIAHGGIHVSSGSFTFPSAPGNELWLDWSGWQDGHKVTLSSLNRRSATQPGPNLTQPWFSADVWSVQDLADTLGTQGVAARFGLGPNDHPEQLDGVVVVAFHFLFPTHRQPREETAHMPESDPYSGDYEGDWTTFAVITRAPAVPEDTLSADDCMPIHVAFGQRWRPVYPDHEGFMFERMMLQPWPEMLKVGEHPVVVAAPGTHNLYPHDMSKEPDGTIRVQWTDMGKSTSEPGNAFVRDSTESSFAGLFALKVLAGFALGGPLGAIVGGIAAGAEAASAEEEGLYETPKLNPEPPPESDDPLAEAASDIEKDKIGKPKSVQNPPLVDPTQSKARDWLSEPKDALVDDSRLLSPYANLETAVFKGRWGVRCTNDPFLIRGGIFFPAYRSQIVDALLTQA